MTKKTANAIGMAKKKTKQSPSASSFQCTLAAIIAISVIEVAFAGFGVIQPIFSYSPANLFFAFLRIAIVVYAGYAASGVARAALRGGALFFASSLAICISVFAAQGIATHPILGVFVFDGMLPVLFAVIIVQNTLTGAAIAAVVAWLSRQKFFQGFFPAKKS